MSAPLALVTGGQQGIGLGIALALKTGGFDLAIVSLPEATSPEVQKAMAMLGDGARYYQHDLADESQASALFDLVERQQGTPDCVVSNAGVPAKSRGDMLELTPESWDFVLGINTRGAFFFAQEAARRMLNSPATRYRSLHFITSVSAEAASVERAEYCISKAGASMMAKLFALRLAAENIGVFEFRPGIIATEMTAGVHDKYTKEIEGGLVPSMRWGRPEDIGRAIVPLATGQMAFATGMIVPIDGGLSLPRL